MIFDIVQFNIVDNCAICDDLGWGCISIILVTMIRGYLLLSLVVLQVLGAAKAPVPYCVAKPEFKEVPLSLGQQMIVNLDNLFSGYNLDITLASKNSFAMLNKKLTELDRVNGYFPNIISHYVEHDGNNWGKQTYILYQDMTGAYIFSYGKIKDEYHVPSVDFTVIINDQVLSGVQCFGAAMLLDYGLAVVDCAKRQKQSLYYENYFIYIDLTSHKITKLVKNPIYVKFTQITKRKIMKYKDIQTGYQFLLRVYPADGVNQEQRHNTYMQIFSVRDPYDIQIMKVIDRTYIHAPTFSIVDAKVYLGDIFVLDYINGLYRLDILHNTDVLITGRYIKDGFTKFAVYSDDLENEVLIALANAHAVYEIDWSNIGDPVMVNKYSLMEHSHVKQLIINDQFMVVQSAANSTNSTHPLFEIDYTWIFSRGARTYTNAYSVINHNSSKAELEFNRYNDRLLVADQSGISLYQISAPTLSISLGDEGKIGTSEDMVLLATSTDPNVADKQTCQIRTKVNFVHSEDMTIYQQGYDTTANYSTNYPSELRINLDRYVLGPNIDYNLINKTAQHNIPEYWVDKLNLTKINFDFGVGDIIFFHTQVVPEFGQQRIIYYVQDSRYYTHVIECVHIWETADVICHEQAKYPHNSAISSFTTAFFTDQEGFNYFYIFTFKSDPKSVWIVDYTRHTYLMNITYQGHQEAEVTGLATSNGFLYILRGAVKTIDVYRLKDCQEQHTCKPDFKIDADTLKPFKVNYFTPEQLVTDWTHPEVLFIRCRGSIIILDIDNKERMVLLDEIISVSTQNSFYRIAVNRERLVIVSNPDILDMYTLEHLYIKNEVKFLKRLPLYSNYQIQAISDIEFSDVDHLIYVNAVDKARNATSILIYRTNKPAAAALYAVIPLRKLYSRPSLEIEVSGFYVDFLNIKTDDGFSLYLCFDSPALVVKDTWLDFKFQIEFNNNKSKLSSELLQIHTVNFPSGFEPLPELNKTLNSLKLDHSQNYTWDDRKWFKGSILSYNFTCPDCGQKPESIVHLKEHVDPMANLHISSYDYAETLEGGVSVYDDLFRFRMNGTVHDVINLPDQKFLERCVKVAAAFHTDLIVTACQELGAGINLYVTTTQSFKPWTWGPYRSSAYRASSLQIAGDILMLTDTDAYPEFKFKKGSIFLYQLGLDNVSGEQMDELEVIDDNDLVMAHGYDKDTAYIANSHLVYVASQRCYRLYVTEVDSGLFVIDFTHELGRRQINILTINYINVKTLLQKFDLHFPSDASFQAVNLVAYKYNPHFYMQSVIITTKNYHNVEITLVYDDDGNVLSSIVHRIYYRYGYYNTVNDVKTSSGYLAISYTIPYTQEYQTNYTRQIVAVYDTLDYPGDHELGYSTRYMLGAFRGNKTNPFVFAFNTTYDWRTNGTRIGLIVTNPYEAPARNMYEMSISRNLTIEVKKGFKDQEITLIPFSDFEVRSFKMKLTNTDDDDDKDKEQKIIIIVVIVLAVLITIGFTAYIFCLIKKRKSKDDGERRSLLTEGESVRHSVEPRAGDYAPPTQNEEEQSSSSSSELSEEEQPKQAPPKTQATPQPQKITVSEVKKTEEPAPVPAAEEKKQEPKQEPKVEAAQKVEEPKVIVPEKEPEPVA